MKDLIDAQVAYVPEVVGVPASTPVVVVGGMGGSALPALLARTLGSSHYLLVHRDYDLPTVLPENASCIAISYSGNTEETLSFAEAALAQGLPLSIITSGGKLLELATTHSLPHVIVPVSFVPRDAVLATTKALLALLGEAPLLSTADLEDTLTQAEADGEELASLCKAFTPIFYTSTRNEALGYVAKVQILETAKRPAFSNVFPEMNHNELEGLGQGGHYVAVFLQSSTDHSQIQKRMELTQQLYEEAGMPTLTLTLPADASHAAIYAWWTARTAARLLAEQEGIDPDATPTIERFKTLL